MSNFVKNSYQFYKDLPGWAKGFVAVVTLGSIVFIGYKVYRKFSPTQDEKDAKRLVKAVDDDITTFRNQGIKQSYATPNYLTFATTIYQGMRYAVGDDYGSVVTTCKKMQNKLDVALLINAFGVKQNYVFGIDSGNPMDMLTFIHSELSNEWWFINRIAQINDDWAAKGIPYRV